MTSKPVMLAKDEDSGHGGCPSVYLDGDELVVQGPASDLSKLVNVLPGETAARIKIGVVRKAMQRLDEAG
jgi:hypothetical protein